MGEDDVTMRAMLCFPAPGKAFLTAGLAVCAAADVILGLSLLAGIPLMG